MRRNRLAIASTFGAVLLAISLTACGDKDPAAEPSGTGATESVNAGGAQPGDKEIESPGESEPSGNGSPEAPADNQDPALPGDPTDPANPDDPVDNAPTAPAPEKTFQPVNYDGPTIPSKCPNSVPDLDQNYTLNSSVKHNDGGADLCITEILARGDATFITEEIAKQLDDIGALQTSYHTEDTMDAVNVISYLVGEHEVVITIQQDGITHLVITYALRAPGGNG